MSLQEVKDEHKQADGDPQMKGMVRERQMRMSRNRMMADVATADVVLVNPTHVAVALKYDPASGAPRVVAKGQGAIATKIRERAHEHRVPLVKDVPLARAVHGACEVGDEIPPELYAAIARVLAFLFALKARGVAAGLRRRGGRGPGPASPLAVPDDVPSCRCSWCCSSSSGGARCGGWCRGGWCCWCCGATSWRTRRPAAPPAGQPRGRTTR